jgi:tetratricopeptide (TPR) repeat protein
MDAAAMQALTGRYKGGSDDLVTIAVRDGKLYREPLHETATELVHIGEGVFVSRMDERRRRFVPDSAGSMTLRVSEGDPDELIAVLPRMKDDEIVPFELVQRGDRDAALRAYSGLLSSDPNNEAVNEQRLNEFGYELMNKGKVEHARDLFFIYMKLYPMSSNVYDSYAEACLKLGDEREALINYRRAAAMDPSNSNATRIVAELERDGIKVE